MADIPIVENLIKRLIKKSLLNTVVYPNKIIVPCIVPKDLACNLERNGFVVDKIDTNGPIRDCKPPLGVLRVVVKKAQGIMPTELSCNVSDFFQNLRLAHPSSTNYGWGTPR